MCGGVYVCLAAALTLRFFKRSASAADSVRGPLPPISIVKPLHGVSDSLAAGLDTFFRQDGADRVQYVFGLQDGADPAVGLIASLRSRYPGRDIEVVVDPRIWGANRKVSNLLNAAAKAKHDVVVMSDADIAVPAHYLRSVAQALTAPGVGAVTCLYVGDAGAGLWSRLGAMAINYHFMTNAIVGKTIGMATPCFGSTIAMTRETLDRIGGLSPFKDQLADDYEIGRAVRAQGLSVAMPAMTVVHRCDEPGFRALIDHEIRWARTVRLIDPNGHAGSFITHALALALLAGALLGFSAAGLIVIFAILGVRIAAKFAIDAATGARAGPWWLLPLRDVLSFGVFLASFFGSTVVWQGRRFRVSRDGVLTPL